MQPHDASGGNKTVSYDLPADRSLRSFAPTSSVQSSRPNSRPSSLHSSRYGDCFDPDKPKWCGTSITTSNVKDLWRTPGHQQTKGELALEGVIREDRESSLKARVAGEFVVSTASPMLPVLPSHPDSASFEISRRMASPSHNPFGLDGFPGPPLGRWVLNRGGRPQCIDGDVDDFADSILRVGSSASTASPHTLVTASSPFAVGVGTGLRSRSSGSRPTPDMLYLAMDDDDVDSFEGEFPVPRGMMAADDPSVRSGANEQHDAGNVAGRTMTNQSLQAGCQEPSMLERCRVVPLARSCHSSDYYHEDGHEQVNTPPPRKSFLTPEPRHCKASSRRSSAGRIMVKTESFEQAEELEELYNRLEKQGEFDVEASGKRMALLMKPSKILANAPSRSKLIGTRPRSRVRKRRVNRKLAPLADARHLELAASSSDNSQRRGGGGGGGGFSRGTSADTSDGNEESPTRCSLMSASKESPNSARARSTELWPSRSTQASGILRQEDKRKVGKVIRGIKEEIKKMRDTLLASDQQVFEPDVWENCGIEAEHLKRQQQLNSLAGALAGALGAHAKEEEAGQVEFHQSERKLASLERSSTKGSPSKRQSQHREVEVNRQATLTRRSTAHTKQKQRTTLQQESPEKYGSPSKQRPTFLDTHRLAAPPGSHHSHDRALSMLINGQHGRSSVVSRSHPTRAIVHDVQASNVRARAR